MIHLALTILSAMFLIWLAVIAIACLLGVILGSGQAIHTQSSVPGGANGPSLNNDERWNYRPEDHGMTRY